MKNATLLFAQKGFGNVTIRDIAKCSDINSAMISYYFKSKDLLLHEILKEHYAPILRFIENIQTERVQPLTKISKIIAFVTNHVFENTESTFIFFQEGMTMGDDYDESKDSITKSHGHLIAKLLELFEEEYHFRSIKPSINPLFIIYALAGTIKEIFYRNKNLLLSDRDHDTQEKILKLKISAMNFQQYLLSSCAEKTQGK